MPRSQATLGYKLSLSGALGHLSHQVLSWFCILTNGSFLFLKKKLLILRDRGSARETLICFPLPYAFTGCFLCVPWLGIEPATLAYRDNTLRNWATWPRSNKWLFSSLNPLHMKEFWSTLLWGGNLFEKARYFLQTKKNTKQTHQPLHVILQFTTFEAAWQPRELQPEFMTDHGRREKRQRWGAAAKNLLTFTEHHREALS